MTETSMLNSRKTRSRCCGGDMSARLTPADAQQVSEDLQILAHPVRLQILDLLAHNEGRVCVCDLESALPVKQPTISHHLKLLAEAGLVGVDRFGLWAYYFVKREALAELRARVLGRLKAIG